MRWFAEHLLHALVIILSISVGLGSIWLVSWLLGDIAKIAGGVIGWFLLLFVGAFPGFIVYEILSGIFDDRLP